MIVDLDHSAVFRYLNARERRVAECRNSCVLGTLCERPTVNVSRRSVSRLNLSAGCERNVKEGLELCSTRCCVLLQSAMVARRLRTFISEALHCFALFIYHTIKFLWHQGERDGRNRIPPIRNRILTYSAIQIADLIRKRVVR